MPLPTHPKIVHLPVALAVRMPLVAGGVLVAWRQTWLPRRTWVLVILLQALLLGTASLALETGEQDEERVERVVPEAALERHEEAGEVFVQAAGVVLLVTLATALIPSEGGALAMALVSCLGMLGVLGLGYRVGEAGGRLVYEHGAAQAFAGPAASARATQGAEGWVRRDEQREVAGYVDDDD